MGAQGARGAGSAPDPRVSSLCLTHPHGGNGGGGPQLLFPTLAGRKAATAATVAAATAERPRSLHRACAWRAPPRAPVGTARAHSRGTGGRGQVESARGGPRVSQPKEAGVAELRRAENDVARARPLLARLLL